MTNWVLWFQLFCYWVSGALVGYGLRGLIFSRQKKRIVDELMEEIKRNRIK